MDALKELHTTTTRNGPIAFFIGLDPSSNIEADSIKDATHVKFSNSELFDINAPTNFYNEDVAQTLKAVVFSWLHEKSSIVDYKNQCIEFGIPDFKFLVKTELNTWLSGNSDTCKFIKSDDVVPTTTTAAVVESSVVVVDEQIERITKFERDSLDHDAALRGSKNLDFGYLVSDAKKLITQLKRSSSTSIPATPNATAPRKQPILIVSPASTALLSLSNIKDFLENGRFIEPNPQNRPTNGITILNHKSDRLLPIAHKIMVVDNVEMFNKLEYWDRVVAIFTNGQEWQFVKYKYSKPEILFQKFQGFYLSYQGDPSPPKIKDWNVIEIKVDRGEKRFRDKMIVKDFWAEVEKALIAKGYGA